MNEANQVRSSLKKVDARGELAVELEEQGIRPGVALCLKERSRMVRNTLSLFPKPQYL